MGPTETLKVGTPVLGRGLGTLRVGGRVVWIPPAPSSPGRVLDLVRPWVPANTVADGLRVLSDSGPDPNDGDLCGISLPIRRAAAPNPDPDGAVASPVRPLFREPYEFLRRTPPWRPALYAVSLDGLDAVAATGGATLTPSTYPATVGAYARLPGFHGIGFGATDHPLTRALVSSVDTQVRVEERFGRTVLFGVRPRTNPYLLDWAERGGRYSLVPLR